MLQLRWASVKKAQIRAKEPNWVSTIHTDTQTHFQGFTQSVFDWHSDQNFLFSFKESRAYRDSFVLLQPHTIVMSTYLTQEGMDRLREELDHMKRVERPSISAQIAEARDKGDLSENAEYDAAKEAQGLLELKISKLEATLSDAVVIDESQLDTDRVLILSKVKLKNQANGMEVEYTIVPEKEADLKAKRISVESPIGKGLLGKKVGEVAAIQVPNGTMNFEVLEIGR